MKVSITMETVQRVDGEEELLRHFATGILRENGDRCCLSYLMDGIHHEMELDRREHRLTVVRNWKEEQQIVYQTGLLHAVRYDTPVGAMDLQFLTHDFFCGQGEDAGELTISLRYEILQFGSKAMDCELKIAILPLKA